MAAATEPKIEEVSDSDEETPDLQDMSKKGAASAQSEKINRAEKKTRKAVSKLGLKPVPGIARIVMKTDKNLLFVVAKPDVFKSTSCDTFVFFGEAKVEDMSPQQNKLAQVAQMAQQQAASGTNPMDLAASKALETVKEEPSSSSSKADSAELTAEMEKNIELVMTQTSCTKAQAIEALKDNNNDVVDAIVALDK